MKLSNVIQTLENIAPLSLAEQWDNVGLLIHPLKPRHVKKVLLTIDLTEAVADEAVAPGSVQNLGGYAFGVGRHSNEMLGNDALVVSGL